MSCFRRVPRSAPVLAAALLAAGCSHVARLVEYQPAAIYSPPEFYQASRDRDFRVDIQGDPFGIDQQRFDRTVTDAMQGRQFGPATHFTTTPGPSAFGGHRVVMVFNPATPFPNDLLCTGQRFPTRPDSAATGIMVQAAYCAGGTIVNGIGRGGGPATSLTGYLDRVEGQDDPAFAGLIGHLTTSLFPPHNPERDNDPGGGGCAGC